jgi:hypothetical protein
MTTSLVPAPFALDFAKKLTAIDCEDDKFKFTRISGVKELVGIALKAAAPVLK